MNSICTQLIILAFMNLNPTTERCLLTLISEWNSSITTKIFWNLQGMLLGFRYYTGPCHLSGWTLAVPCPAQHPMTATSLLSLQASSKVPLRNKLLPLPVSFPLLFSRSRLALSSSSFSLYVSFSLSYPASFISIKLSCKFWLHGILSITHCGFSPPPLPQRPHPCMVLWPT